MKRDRILIFLLVLSMLSCTTDKEKFPGYICSNGECIAVDKNPEYISLQDCKSDCSSSTPTQPTNCPQGYTGEKCDKQITPKKITITKIQVTKFPANRSSGEGWDASSRPDLVVRLFRETTEIWASPNNIPDAVQGVAYDFNPSPSITITNMTSVYYLKLYDYDLFTTATYELMGQESFMIYSSTNKFPSTLTIDKGGFVAFKLYLTYSW